MGGDQFQTMKAAQPIEGARGVVQLLAASANANFADKIAAGLLRAGYQLDPGAFDPARIDATVVLWSGVALDKPELVAAAREAWKAGRLAPVSIGRIEPPFGARDAAPMDLAGWDGGDDDPRWRFVLSDLEVIQVRKGFAPVAEVPAGGDLAAASFAPNDEGLRVYHPARQLWRRRIRPAAAPFAAGMALISAAGVAAFSIGVRSDPAAAVPPALAAVAAEEAPPQGETRLDPPESATLAFVRPAEDFDAAGDVAPNDNEAPGANEETAPETLEDPLVATSASAVETPPSLVAADDGAVALADAEEAPAADVDAFAAPSLKPEAENIPVTEDSTLAADLNQRALEAMTVSAPEIAPAASVQAAAARAETFSDCAECPEMAALDGGAFVMGAAPDEAGRLPQESPQRRVNIGYRFAIAVRETSFDQWAACVAEGGCRAYAPDDAGWGRGDRPVINVSYEDASAYARWLSAKTGNYYRLPSEAEWEYAARGGGGGAFGVGAGLGAGLSGGQANINGRLPYGAPSGLFRARTVSVKSFAANAFGLFDMHGNVWEWTSDCWSANHNGAPATGAARIDGDCNRRVIKGGAWNTPASAARSAHRESADQMAQSNDVGFRVVRVME